MDAARIGNTVLDDGHETLSRQLTALMDFWKEATDREGLVAALNAFIGQLRCHFSLEEVILEGAGYPQAEAHAARHAEILQILTQHRNDLGTDSSVRPAKVMEKIHSLLCEHELSEDSRYWPWMTKAQDSASEGEPEKNTAPRRRRSAQWHDGYLTGNEKIDAHHQALITYADRLNQSAAKASVEDFSSSIRDFRALAGHHFQVEEMLLEGRDDAAARAHRETHNALLRSLDGMIERVRQERLSPVTFVQDFLAFWMLNHIAESDLQDFADHKSAIKAGRDAALA